MSGVVTSDKSGLLFYDHDRELFLHQPVFSDILASSAQTAIQVSVINEFGRVQTWDDLRQFFAKLDKVLVLDQFRQYLADHNNPMGKEIFLSRATEFCRREGINLSRSQLAADDGLRLIELELSSVVKLKSGFFIEAVPDILQPRPDPSLCRVFEQRRAQRWYALASKEGKIPGEVAAALSGKSQHELNRAIVDRYMSTVEEWEGSPLGKIGNDTYSRADLEDILTGASTTYCPSPLGWTPRLRFSFYPPESFRNEERAVQIEVISQLERRLMRAIGIKVKLLYIPAHNCIVFEHVGGETGGRQINCTFDNSQVCEVSILNLESEDLLDLSTAVHTARQQMAPDVMLQVIDEARAEVEAQRAEMQDSVSFREEEQDYERHEEIDEMAPQY